MSLCISHNLLAADEEIAGLAIYSDKLTQTYSVVVVSNTGTDGLPLVNQNLYSAPIL